MALTKRSSILLFLFTFYVVSTILYYSLFVYGSDNDISPDGNFSRTIIPDVILYRQIAAALRSDGPDHLLVGSVTAQLQISSLNEMNILLLATKNFFGPSFLAYVANSITFGDLFLNILLVGLSGIFLYKILAVLGINSLIPFAILLLNPETLYYSQGPLKEIPCLFLTIAFTFFLMKNRHSYCLVIIALVSVVRYQVAMVFLLVLFLELIPSRHRLKFVQFSLLIFFSLLPYLYSVVLSRLVEGYYIYRIEGGPGTGLGSAMAELHFNIPLFGYISVPFRFLQNMIEPFPAVQLFADGEGVVNLYFCVLSISLLMMGYFYIIFFKHLLQLILTTPNSFFDEKISKVTMVILSYFFVVGINTFISHRFIYPTLPLMTLFLFLRGKCYNFLFRYVMVSMIIFVVYLLNLSRNLFTS